MLYWLCKPEIVFFCFFSPQFSNILPFYYFQSRTVRNDECKAFPASQLGNSAETLFLPLTHTLTHPQISALTGTGASLLQFSRDPSGQVISSALISELRKFAQEYQISVSLMCSRRWKMRRNEISGASDWHADAIEGIEGRLEAHTISDSCCKCKTNKPAVKSNFQTLLSKLLSENAKTQHTKFVAPFSSGQCYIFQNL